MQRCNAATGCNLQPATPNENRTGTRTTEPAEEPNRNRARTGKSVLWDKRGHFIRKRIIILPALLGANPNAQHGPWVSLVGVVVLFCHAQSQRNCRCAFTMLIGRALLAKIRPPRLTPREIQEQVDITRAAVLTSAYAVGRRQQQQQQQHGDDGDAEAYSYDRLEKEIEAMKPLARKRRAQVALNDQVNTILHSGVLHATATTAACRCCMPAFLRSEPTARRIPNYSSTLQPHCCSAQ